MSDPKPLRVVLFGATGHLGQAVLERLADTDWPLAELEAVASPESAGLELELRGEPVEVRGDWPVLKGRDLVLACTPEPVALEVVREALRAEVPCVDCSGVLAQQAEVPMPVRRSALEAEAATLVRSPLLAVPSAATLAWTPILDALQEAAGVRRVVATVLCSASTWGRRGVLSLSSETIALFNQTDRPEAGPAGQEVAFDVIPAGRDDDDRLVAELERVFGAGLAVSRTSVQVPTFLGEGASLAIELDAPLEADRVEASLAAREELTIVAEGIGSRGLAPVEEGMREPSGPTLRDSMQGGILLGRLRPDPSLPEGRGWRLWLSFDPVALVAEHALRLAALRLGASPPPPPDPAA